MAGRWHGYAARIDAALLRLFGVLIAVLVTVSAPSPMAPFEARGGNPEFCHYTGDDVIQRSGETFSFSAGHR